LKYLKLKKGGKTDDLTQAAALPILPVTFLAIVSNYVLGKEARRGVANTVIWIEQVQNQLKENAYHASDCKSISKTSSKKGNFNYESFNA
jgi:hypothetical protein